MAGPLTFIPVCEGAAFPLFRFLHKKSIFSLEKSITMYYLTGK